MGHQDNNKTYALYTYISTEIDDKCGATPNTYSNFYPNLYTKLKVLNQMISYAIKYFYGVELEESKPTKCLKEGKGFVEGFYFSTAECGRIIAVSVSKAPTGIQVQIPFPIYDEQEYALFNFSENELKEYHMMKFGEDTYYYIFCQKKAYQKKYQLLFKEPKDIDSTQEEYTFYKDSILDTPLIFAATGPVEYIRKDIEEIML